MRRAAVPQSLPVAATALLAASLLLAPAIGRADDGVVGPDNCDQAGFFGVLAHVQATGGGTISFDCGPEPSTIVITTYREISAPVTIDGGGLVTLDGNDRAAFFQIFVSGSLHLRRLRLHRGTYSGVNPLSNLGRLRLDQVQVEDSSGSGSALRSSGQLQIWNSRFSGNTIDAGTTRRGAAVLNLGGSVAVTDTRFEQNSIPGLDSIGGAVASLGGTLTVRRSQFTGNSADSGGAVFLSAGTVARIEHSDFSGNSAGYGGAMLSWAASTEVANSRFHDNQASTGDGGAIWSPGTKLLVDGSSFAGNTSAWTGGAISCFGQVLTVVDSAFVANGAGRPGGAIYSGCELSVANTSFDGNSAVGPGNSGGAIAQTGPRSGTAIFVTATGNSAADGGAVHNDGYASNSLAVGSSLLAANPGGNCAGAIESSGYNLSADASCGGAFTAVGDGNGIELPLQPLGDYGGPTPTRPPQPGNPAIDRIPPAACAVPADQRGAARPVNGNCDSGAVEVGGIVDAIYADGFQ